LEGGTKIFQILTERGQRCSLLPAAFFGSRGLAFLLSRFDLGQAGLFGGSKFGLPAGLGCALIGLGLYAVGSLLYSVRQRRVRHSVQVEIAIVP
jgi:hypothetical protein